MKKTKPDPVALKTTFSAGRVYISRQSAVIELAKMKGHDLQLHEGFMRDNNGDWALGIQHPDGERTGFAMIRAVAESKRGRESDTPDPEGQANAFEVVRRWNAFPELLEALQGILGGNMNALPLESITRARDAVARAVAAIAPDLR